MEDTAQVVAIAFEFYAPQLSEHGLRAGGLVEQALELVPTDSLDAGRLHAYRGNVLGLGQGDYQSARDSLDRALTVARQRGNAALEIRALITSAQLESWNNHFEDGMAYGLTAIEKAVAASDLRGEVTARFWACLGSFNSGDTQETKRQSSVLLESAIAYATATGWQPPMSRWPAHLSLLGSGNQPLRWSNPDWTRCCMTRVSSSIGTPLPVEGEATRGGLPDDQEEERAW